MQRTMALAAVMTILMATSAALAVEPPPFDKDTAAKLLDFMGYKDITVKAVVQGVTYHGTGLFSGLGPNTASVMADVADDGTPKRTRVGKILNFFYDSDLGWFCFEPPQDRNGQKLRIWSAKGYQETTPISEKPANTSRPSGTSLHEQDRDFQQLAIRSVKAIYMRIAIYLTGKAGRYSEELAAVVRNKDHK